MNTTLSRVPFFGKKKEDTDIQIFNNPEFGEIRTVIINNEPWFVARDLSEKLGYQQTNNMKKLIDADDTKEIDPQNLEFSGLLQNGASALEPNKFIRRLLLINESGLYAAIFNSTQPNAKRFKKWVTSEVLPSIRKTGGYNAPELPTTPQGQIKLLAQGFTEMQEQINTVSDTVNTVKSDFDTFKEDCPLFPAEADKITQAARHKGVEVMGGKHSQAYHDRSIVQLVYRDIYGEIHRNFDCRSYKEIPRKSIGKVLEVISRYSLPITLQDKIDTVNSE